MDIYFDNSATTAVSKEAADKAYEIMLSGFGNPSSLHHMGVVAEEELKTARKNVALLLSRDEKGIIFTASGTEANNLAILGSVKTAKKKGNKIITAVIEHPSVLEPCRYLERNGFEVSYIKVDRDGIIDLEQFEEALDENTVLVSVMSANNEVGTIQPLKQIASFKDKYDFILHTDMVQGMAKIKGEEIPREVDLISVSGHKIHAPKGVGGLWIRDKLNLSPIVFGGGQEKGLRSGTENLPAIAGFSVASDQAFRNFDERIEKIKTLRNSLKEGLENEVNDIRINTPLDISIPSILNVTFMDVRAEVLLHTLEQDGIYVSTGSACSSNKKGESHVLKAMGLKNADIEGAIRFSLSGYNTYKEVETVVEKVKNAVISFRRLGSLRQMR